MLLQASVVCRVIVINTAQKDNKKEFVLICYYINKQYHAERYIVYQPNDTDEQKVSLSPLLFSFCSLVF
jgi:hypothetical protein